ncbi:MAG: hypothetical protein HY843_07340 [Bdellovibrio sp.]|nr:hypothetical protein [Bdellovibrio sp.]
MGKLRSVIYFLVISIFILPAFFIINSPFLFSGCSIMDHDPNGLISAFPFGVLKKDATLLDLSNTETTYEYYLLENLSMGLIRDDVREPSGYASAIAESWKQKNSKTWQFKIKSPLFWSDGSPMHG